jgi:hypothetical protein
MARSKDAGKPSCSFSSRVSMRCTDRQAGVFDGALLQRQQRVARRRALVGGVGPAFQRRRGRAEHDRHAAFAARKTATSRAE